MSMTDHEKERVDESHFLIINKEKFECKCGVNLFHYDCAAPCNKEWHVCNGCGLTYESEKKE